MSEQNEEIRGALTQPFWVIKGKLAVFSGSADELPASGTLRALGIREILFLNHDSLPHGQSPSSVSHTALTLQIGSNKACRELQAIETWLAEHACTRNPVLLVAESGQIRLAVADYLMSQYDLGADKAIEIVTAPMTQDGQQWPREALALLSRTKLHSPPVSLALVPPSRPTGVRVRQHASGARAAII